VIDWTPLHEDAGLWCAEWQAGGAPINRSVALRLRDGGTVVVSPLAKAPPESDETLRQLGEPRFLLAPNHFHNLGLKPYRARFPDAAVVASEVAAKRLGRVAKVDVGPLAALVDALPDHATLLQPPGTRNGEVWLRVETAAGVAWVVTDAFFRFDPLPTGPNGWILRTFGVRAGLGIIGTFKFVGLADRPAYGAWLREQLATDPPSVLISAHGHLAGGPELPGQLSALVKRHFGG